MKTKLVASVIAALVLVGCAGETGSEGDIGRTKSAIIDGTDSDSADDAVVVIAYRTRGFARDYCSGTLVAPNLVLTARHCVSDTDAKIQCNADGVAEQGGKVTSDRAPAELHVYVGKTAIADTLADGNASTHAVAAGATIVTDHATTVCNADIAFLVLDQAIEGTYAPLRLDAPGVGDKLRAVGFGLTADGTHPAVRQERDVEIAKVGPWAASATAGLGDAELLTSEGACSGDSGSPLFSDSHAVVAVASRVAGGDGTGPAASCVGAKALAFYDMLGMKKALVDDAFAQAGQPVWLEGQPSPFASKPAAAQGTAPPPADASTSGGCAASPKRVDLGSLGLHAVLFALVLLARRRSA